MTALLATRTSLPPVFAPPPVVATPAAATDHDALWTAWLARGHASDVRLRRRMTRILWLTAAGFVFWQARIAVT